MTMTNNNKNEQHQQPRYSGAVHFGLRGTGDQQHVERAENHDSQKHSRPPHHHDENNRDGRKGGS